MSYVAVLVGGALGSLVREGLLPWFPVLWPLTSTFFINALACLLIGVLYGMRHRIHVQLMHLAAVGFCGGMSSFSSFAADLFELGAGGEVSAALMAAALEIAVGLLAAIIGERIGVRVGGPARP